MNSIHKEDTQVRAIAERIRQEKELDVEFPGGLFGGLAGRALFLLYAGAWLEEERYLDVAWEQIEGALAALEAKPHNSLDGGLIGLGWLLQHAVGQGFIEVDVAELLSQADQILDQALPSWFEATNRDYMHGATGVLLYWRHRQVPLREATLSRYIDGMLRARTKDAEGGSHWKQLTDVETGDFGTTVGLAHGIANMVRAFTWIHQMGIRPEECRGIVEELFTYLERHRLPEHEESIYPFSIVNDQATVPSRLAWCHGDLGVAFAYWLAGEALDVPSWQEHAKQIWLHASQRIALNLDPGIGLCHGHASLAYLFSRAHQYTQLAELKEAADLWQERSLAATAAKLSDPEVALGELLSGFSGVGLSHLHFLFPEKKSAWDEWMLLR